MTLPLTLLALALAGTAPVLLGPGPAAQTTQETIRFYLDAYPAPPVPPPEAPGRADDPDAGLAPDTSDAGAVATVMASGAVAVPPAPTPDTSDAGPVSSEGSDGGVVATAEIPDAGPAPEIVYEVKRFTVTVNDKPAGSCLMGEKRKNIAHCQVPVERGDNKVVVSDGTDKVELSVIRYVTTEPLLPGFEMLSFGANPLHRLEVEARCQSCHPINEVEGKEPNETLFGSECLKCHPGYTDRKVEHGPVGQGACLMCHESKANPQRFSVQWPIQETCYGCHKDIEYAMATKAYRHGPTAAGRCTTCHDPHGSENAFWLKKPVFKLCTNCHPEKADGRHIVVGFVYGDSHPVQGRPHPVKPGQEFTCTGCHNPHASQSRFMWQYDARVREELCRTCHSK